MSFDPQKIFGKIIEKTRSAVRRSGEKIPYTAEKDVFDDCSGDISWWTNGFWAGMLWQLYGACGEPSFRKTAEHIEEKLDESLMSAKGMDHDSGFKWLLTSGANYTLTKSEASKNRLLLAAGNLAGRFNPAGKFLRAWNDGGDGSAAGVAIIDCMMNLPLLYRAGELTRDPRFSQIATLHADTAASAFVRGDGSVCHIVEFDPATGVRKGSRAGQGYAHGSAWTRGQAWALYGFALSYRHTGRKNYLTTAERVADYFLTNIPASGLVPVDFLQPPTPAYEDDSAAAIAACGLLELSELAGKRNYHDAAVRLLAALDGQRCDYDPAHDQLLTRCSAAYHDDRHGFPLIYGDYFYTEAIAKLIGKETFVW